ncbi:MAG: 50S ribosomal protein L32 [Candidatus Paceibacterota bacterium]
MTVRMRHTRSHTANRRSHHALSGVRVSLDNGVPHQRHRASATTGMYRGKKVIDVEKKINKQLERQKQHAEANPAHTHESEGETKALPANK